MSYAQCPAVKTTLRKREAITVPEQAKSPTPGIVKKTFPCTRLGKLVSAPASTSASSPRVEWILTTRPRVREALDEPGLGRTVAPESCGRSLGAADSILSGVQ